METSDTRVTITETVQTGGDLKTLFNIPFQLRNLNWHWSCKNNVEKLEFMVSVNPQTSGRFWAVKADISLKISNSADKSETETLTYPYQFFNPNTTKVVFNSNNLSKYDKIRLDFDAVFRSDSGLRSKTLLIPEENFFVRTDLSDLCIRLKGKILIYVNCGRLAHYCKYFELQLTQIKAHYLKGNSEMLEIREARSVDHFLYFLTLAMEDDAPPLGDSTIEEISNMADYYACDRLLKKCETYLCSNLCKVAIVTRLLMACDYQMSYLESFCLRRLKCWDELSKAKKHKNFKKLPKKIVELIDKC